ncbi:MAG TPA: hypothetical protein VD994_02260, partial [Prosthecobacter sp.]|nr:hypothetical protein [Prosthecobacter sp.]
TLTASTGGFSGKVLIDGLSKTFVATFYGDGSAVFTVGAVKQSALAFAGKTLTLSYAGDVITATVNHGSESSTGTATRAIYSSSNRVPAALLNSANSGFYTVGFPAKAQVSGMTASQFPQGNGYCTLTVSNLGAVNVAGKLADGTLVTGSSALVAGNACPIFLQLITPGAAATVKGGCFGGVLSFDTSPADSDVNGSDLLWIRPAVTQLSAPAAAAAATRLYSEGWPSGIYVDAVGGLYSKTVTVQAGLGIGATDAVNGNAELTFTDGKLTESISKSLFNINGNSVAKIPAADSSYTLSLAATTGSFSGTFTPDWASPSTIKPAYSGILIQKGANKGGFGFFLSNAKDDVDPESGSVTLGTQAE